MPLGPRKLSLITFLSRLFGSFAGGICGTLTIFAIFIFGSAVMSREAEAPLSMFIILLIVLLGSMVTNLITGLLVTFLDREQHPRILTTITQIFILNLILFIFSIPIYLLVGQFAIEKSTLGIVAAFHLLVTIQASALVVEILGKGVYKMVSVYGVGLGAMFSFGVIILVYLFGKETFLLFLIAPLLTFSIELFRSLTEILYGVYYRLYGIDVLSSETVLSEDES